ncbi:hypothetical protein MASR1M74_12420 [Lentimicrobium sp.]
MTPVIALYIKELKKITVKLGIYFQYGFSEELRGRAVNKSGWLRPGSAMIRNVRTKRSSTAAQTPKSRSD